MGCGKSAKLLTMFDAYKRRKKKPLIIKPSVDNREGTFHGWGITKSRITKNEEPTFYFSELKKEIEGLDFGVLFVDEVQFLTRDDILFLCSIADSKDIDVFCFGLKTDIHGQLFTGSEALFALADEIEEIESLCEEDGCKEKAVCHVRYVDGVRQVNGETVAIETGNVTYKSVCRKHWKKQ